MTVRKTSKVRLSFKPCAELLPDRITPAGFWWRPVEALRIDDESLAAIAGNWTDGPGANSNVWNRPPGANDTLFIDGGGDFIDDCTINVALPDDGILAASGTYAAIIYNGNPENEAEYKVIPEISVTFTGTDASNPNNVINNIASQITYGMIDGYLDGGEAATTMSFSGSPVSGAEKGSGVDFS
jgi:hypothetical protein